MDISLTKLRHLVAIAQAQSFSRAAEMLHVSQPALSRSITSLEQAYGVRIFERSRLGALATFAGAQIITEAEELLSKAKTFDHNFRMVAKGKGGNLTIGMGPALAGPILAKLAKTLMERDSQIHLRALTRSTDVLVEYLISEAIELFISPSEHITLPSEVSSDLIGYVQGGFLARNGHPLASKIDMEIRDIFKYPYASARHSILRERYSQDTASFVCDNDSVLFDLIETSDVICVSTLESAAKELESGRLVKLQPLDFHFEPSGVFVTRIRGRTMSPMGSEVVRICKTYLAESAKSQ